MDRSGIRLCVPEHICKNVKTHHHIESEVWVDGKFERAFMAYLTHRGELVSATLYEVMNRTSDIYDVEFEFDENKVLKISVTTMAPQLLDMKDTSSLFAQVMLYFAMVKAGEERIARFMKVFYFHGMGEQWQRRLERWLTNELHNRRVHMAIEYLCNVPMF